jgi:4a-hydroxytetrahydrobiopterin dehydratase
VKPLTLEEARESLKPLPGWILRNGVIEKEFRFRSYRLGLEFAYAVGNTAEEENHHPDIVVGWRRVKVTFSTHAIKGLSRNDFIMAAKAELQYETVS